MNHDRPNVGRTYFYSEFTAPSTSTLLVQNIHKAASNEHLSLNWKSKHSKSRLSVINHCYIENLIKAHSAQDLRKEDRKPAKLTASCASTAEETDPTLRLEFEQELEEHLQKLLKKSRFNAVTVPSSVKFSVTGDTPNRQSQLAFAVSSNGSTMSRPRSPKSKEPQQLEGLDQLLYNIRQQLNQLSDERTQMEQRMEDVVNGIQHAQAQYHNQLRNIYQNRKQGSKHSPPTPGLLRRVHSSGEKYTNSTWLIPRTSETSLNAQDFPDGNASASSQKQHQTPTRTLKFDDSNFQCSHDDVSIKESIADSAYGGSCSTLKGPRSDSISSTETRSYSSSLNVAGSLSQSTEVFGNWLSANTIPELPESPRPVAPSSLSQDSFMQSMPALNYHSHTTPNRYGHPASSTYHQHRSYSTSTPKNYSVKVASSSPEVSSFEPSFRATSSPDVSRKCVSASPACYNHRGHSHFYRSSQHNSPTDSMMNSVILEHKLDCQNFGESLSQVSIRTDSGSPKSTSSTVIVRRSSLTGQLEHVHKPRLVAVVKRNSSFDVSKERSTRLDVARARASSVYGLHKTIPDDFRVLNRGIRKKKRKPVILNTSVETTV